MTDEQIIEARKAAGRLDTVGDNLQQAVAMVRALLAAGGKGEAVVKITGADEYGPMLEWRTHWVELIGKSLYTAPQAECAPRVDAYAFKCDGRLWVVTDPAVAMRWQAQGFEVTPVERADAEKDAALTDKQLDAAIEAWFSDAIIDCGQRVRMRAAILAANKEPQP